jgi:hypothetical protein
MIKREEVSMTRNLTNGPWKVKVSQTAIRTGIAGDCYRCPIVRAVQRVTSDDEARIVERDWEYFLCVWGRWIELPEPAMSFVVAFDRLDRKKSNRVNLPDLVPRDLQPFTFELPPLDSLEWRAECYRCEQLFAAEELDEEGYCGECLAHLDLLNSEESVNL